MFNELKIESGADFSLSRKFRYSLWRIWNRDKPLVMFIGLNPSTANEHNSDPTITRITKFSLDNGYGGFYMMNCFPLVSADPKALNEWIAGTHRNYYQLFLKTNNELKGVASKCRDVVFCWGSFAIVKDIGRDLELIRMFPDALCFGKNTDGSPKHPLYLHHKTPLIPFQSKPENRTL